MSEISVWEAWKSDEMHPGGRDLTRRMLESAGLLHGARVADIGCGTGAGVAFLRAQGFDASGVDSSALLAGCARKRHGVPVFLADARSLPFEARSMDALLFECSLNALDDRATVLGECARVLRCGGKLMVSDVYDKAAPEPEREWKDALAAAGFSLLRWEDCSGVMERFVARALWELGDIARLKDICTKGDQSCRPGYFIMVAKYDQRAERS